MRGGGGRRGEFKVNLTVLTTLKHLAIVVSFCSKFAV